MKYYQTIATVQTRKRGSRMKKKTDELKKNLQTEAFIQSKKTVQPLAQFSMEMLAEPLRM
jgi:hypothetical protein